MTPTIPIHPAQRIDQVTADGVLIKELVYTYPFDGTGILRRKGQPDKNVTGLEIPSESVPAKRTEIRDLSVTQGFNQAYVDDANPNAAKIAAQVKNLTIQMNRILKFIEETQEGKN